MGCFSGKENRVHSYPLELDEYQKSKQSQNSNINSLHPRNRKPTDVCFLTVFATYLTILCCFIVYCAYHGNIGRVIQGYDNCGTVCGDTKRVKELQECYKSMDENNFGSYHLVVHNTAQPKLYDRVCTRNCSFYPGYKEFLNRCLPTSKKTALDEFFSKTGLRDFFVEMTEDFELYWKIFICMCGISLVISVCFLLLFPFLAGALVWIILVGAIIACLAATIYLWIEWKDLKDLQQLDSEIKQREVWTYLGLAILLSCITLGLIAIIIVMIKRIKLVIQLFQEAGKAISSMPALLFEPILTFLSLTFTICLWIYFCLWISSAGYLTEKRQNVYYYKKDGYMEATKVLNIFGMLWMIQFVIGCQHMVIAGAVSKWYFTRTKSELSMPITESFYNLSRYHLGTVATGSFLLAIVQILRLLLAGLQKMIKNEKNSVIAYLTKTCLCFCSCCLWILERLLSMLSRNAYIITAMYGYPFYKAGRQAFTHLSSNPLRVAAINSVGDFVLFLSKVLVVACCVAAGSYFLKNREGIQHPWVPLVLIGLFSYFICHCFMTVYEMTIDTIFICFCEDCELNDGLSKPYYMSRGLMEFVENSRNSSEIYNKNEDFRSKNQTVEEIPTVSQSVQKE